MKTLPLGPFLGVNNRLPAFSLHVPKVGDFLSSGENIDIDNSGSIRRGMATAMAQAMTGAHSLHMDTATTGYIVRDAVLYAITLPDYTETLFKVLTSDALVTWHAAGDDLYYASATDGGRITAGVWYPLGLPTPEAPALSAIGGNLLDSAYQVGVSYSNSVTGEEGGISAYGRHVLTSIGGLRVTLPAATPGATHINIYLSESNGSVPRWLASVATGTATYDCIALATGREAKERFQEPLTPGALFMSNGRLCSFSGNRVCVGLPWRFGYYRPDEGYIDFQAPVSIAVENQGGTYIIAEKTRWFPGGDLNNVEAMVGDVLPYGAVPGTVFHDPDKPLVGWFGEKGVVVADTQGQCVALTAENVDVVAPSSGVSCVFDSDGYSRVVSCGWCVNLENKAATPYSGWVFTSASGGYATKDDGLYALNVEGPVDAVIGFGKQNFGSEAHKHLPAVYLGVESDETMQLRVQAPNEIDYTYPARSRGADLQMQRIDPGKGLRSNWFGLSLMNQNGEDFTLASVSFAPTASTRRI